MDGIELLPQLDTPLWENFGAYYGVQRLIAESGLALKQTPIHDTRLYLQHATADKLYLNNFRTIYSVAVCSDIRRLFSELS